eukprot:936675-Pelagomonas_calceolata.AAC.7
MLLGATLTTLSPAYSFRGAVAQCGLSVWIGLISVMQLGGAGCLCSSPKFCYPGTDTCWLIECALDLSYVEGNGRLLMQLAKWGLNFRAKTFIEG